MQAGMLNRLMELSRKTGDRLVVVEGDTAVVLLPLERYEELLGRGAAGATAAVAPAGFEDPISAANRKMAELREFLPQTALVPAVMDQVQNEEDDQVNEEQFYLEPVE